MLLTNQYVVTASTLTWDIYSTFNWPAKCTTQTGTRSKLTGNRFTLHWTSFNMSLERRGCVVKVFCCFFFMVGQCVNKTLIHKQMNFCLFTSWLCVAPHGLQFRKQAGGGHSGPSSALVGSLPLSLLEYPTVGTYRICIVVLMYYAS